MKLGFFIIGAMLIGSILAHFLLTDPGYVVVHFQGHIIEMSVPVLAGLIAVVLISVWLLYRLIRLPRKIGEAAGQVMSARHGRQFTKGLIAAAEGRLAKGERLLTRGAASAETPLLNYLAAARVAHQQGATERRDNWLTMAYEQNPDARNAVLLTQAELQLANAQFEQALATLTRIREDVPEHDQAIYLLGRTYGAIEDWEKLSDLLPKLRKQKRIEVSLLDQWEAQVQQQALSRASGDGDKLREVWNGFSKTARLQADLVGRYTDLLAEAGDSGEAETILRKTLSKDWHPELVRRYGTLAVSDTAKQLKTVEGWLKNRGDDAALLQAAGRICIRDELWGKARSYLESAIALTPSPDAYQAYGELLTALGEDEPAALAFRKGLSLAAGATTLQLTGPDSGGSGNSAS